MLWSNEIQNVDAVYLLLAYHQTLQILHFHTPSTVLVHPQERGAH